MIARASSSAFNAALASAIDLSKIATSPAAFSGMGGIGRASTPMLKPSSFSVSAQPGSVATWRASLPRVIDFA